MKLEKALEPRRTVLRPLALVAVRQQHDEAGHAQPLAFAGGDEIVDDHLRAVGEVAELRLPQHQRVGVGEAEAVFEAEHRRFRQHRIGHLEPRLAGFEEVERDVARFRPLVDDHRVALRKGAAA